MAASNQDGFPQPQPSRLLSLPTELRLMICGYMTLSPASVDSLAFKGAYFACRELHDDMRDALKPDQDLTKYIASERTSWQNTGHEWNITIGLPHPQLELIRDITIQTPLILWLREDYSYYTIALLYKLYLDHLHIVLTGPEDLYQLEHGLKSCDPPLFFHLVRNAKLNCKKVTLTIDGLANVEDGRIKSTRLINMVPDTKISYSLDIVQDEKGRQSERVYSSHSRFKPRRSQIL